MIDRLIYIIALVFITTWFFGSVYSLSYLNASLFQRFGSVGTVGAAMLAVDYSRSEDYGLVRELRFSEKLNSFILSRESFFLIVVTISTIQWGFGDILANALLTCGAAPC